MKIQNENSNGSQVMFDICLTIGSIQNIAESWSPKFNFNIYFQIADSQNYPCPYQIMQSDKILGSSIDLRCYQAGQLLLSSMQQKIIKEMCLFRAALTIKDLQQKQLSCFIDFCIEQKIFGTVTFNYNSCLGLCNYLPIYSPCLGIIINAKVQTQLLGIRAYKNCSQDSTFAIYRTLNWIFDQSNRLTHKLKNFQNVKQELKTLASTSNSYTNKLIQPLQSYPQDIYKQYTKLKQFRESRIFRKKSTELHREQLSNFIMKIRGQYTNNLQINWQKYIKMALSQSITCIQDLKNKFIQHFAYQISQKVIRNHGLQNRNACQLTVDQIKININGFQIKNLTEHNLLKNSHYIDDISISSSNKHVIVLMHGFGANSYGMSLIQRNIKFIYPHIEILNARSNQNQQSDFNIETMGRKLAIQIQQFLNSLNNINEIEISFIGHSLGGLVVRAALTHLQVLKFNMNSFISLSTPHLGHIQHSNKLAKFGMIALNTIEQLDVIDELLLKDNSDPRQSYLYSLSTHSGLSWFRSIVLYGSENDGYVSTNSALMQPFNESRKIYKQMAKNLDEITKNTNISKFEIKFTHQKRGFKPDISQMLVGRSSHLAFPTHQSFINFLLFQNYKYFKAENTSLSEDSF